MRKDGTFFWASVVIDPVYEDGNLIGFAKITRDITERREAQLKLEQMQQQLAELQKLDALGQLTGGVAHDFNNLLMIISGSLHTLKKGMDDDPRRVRAISAIEAATQRGAALTNQLLTFARRQSVNPQAVDVSERIDAVREVLDTGVGSAVTLQFDIDRTSGRPWSMSPSSKRRWSISSSMRATPCPPAARSPFQHITKRSVKKSRPATMSRSR